jgi:hypothetical protein
MGEYATLDGTTVKIGTCEDMYYLRWDQRDRITGYEFDGTERFRFPFPWEDHIEPGSFVDAFESFRLDGFEQPADVEHGTLQFSAPNGYLVSLPCPEVTPETETYRIARNGYGGPASLIQQAWRGGRLVGIVKCNGCGAIYRLEDGYEEAAAVSIRDAADAARGRGNANASRLHDMADRLLAGYSAQS